MSDFESELELLRRHLDAARAGTLETDALLADLETAHEELVVADEEVRTQELELKRMLHAQRLGMWQHERLLAMLPAAVLVTDANGQIHTVNAAAASMLRARVDRLIRKPIFTLIDYSDRGELRNRLSLAARSERELRMTVTLLPRAAPPRVVEVVASASRNSASGLIDVTWLLIAPDPMTISPNSVSHTPSIRALVELTRLPLHDEDDTEIFRRVAAICARAIAPEASVTLTVGPPTAPATLASTDGLAQHLDGAQLVAGEGPCVAAWESASVVTSDDLPHDSRWANLASRLDAGDVRGVVAAPVQLGDDVVGVLNVYLPEDPPDEETIDVTTMLGGTVGAIMHEMAAKAELLQTAKQLQAAMASRSEIEQAKGIVMATHGCGPDKAFEVLVERSNNENVKLRELARRIVSDPGSRG